MSEPRVNGSGWGNALLPVLIQAIPRPNPGRRDAHQHFSWAGARRRDFLEGYHIGRPEPMDAGGFHANPRGKCDGAAM